MARNDGVSVHVVAADGTVSLRIFDSDGESWVFPVIAWEVRIDEDGDVDAWPVCPEDWRTALAWCFEYRRSDSTLYSFQDAMCTSDFEQAKAFAMERAVQRAKDRERKATK